MGHLKHHLANTVPGRWMFILVTASSQTCLYHPAKSANSPRSASSSSLVVEVSRRGGGKSGSGILESVILAFWEQGFGTLRCIAAALLTGPP